MAGLAGFLTELRRRRVFRAMALYGAAAWLVIQIADNTFSHLQLPDWSVRFVIVLLLLGLPVALALSWAFDMTPTGIARAESVRSAPPDRQTFWRGWSFWLALAGGVAMGLGAVQGWRVWTTQETPSIAVLPFEIFSANAADGFLAAGLHDELLAQLARVPRLDVRSRSSVRDFAGPTRPSIPEIARRLNVGHLVEGSVQVVDGRVRIRVQLIDGRSDRHLWAETYERPVHDVFRLQVELAREITQALSGSLSGEEIAVWTQHAAVNPDAYRLYLVALGVEQELERSGANADDAAISEPIDLLRQVAKMDPRFALGHSALAERLSARGMSEQVQAEAMHHALTAIRLAPASSDANRALGRFYLAMRQDNLAQAYLVRALELAPNDVAASRALGWLEEGRGQWEAAARYFERALRIQPNDVGTANDLGALYSALLRFGDAMRTYEAAIDAAPDAAWLYIWRAILVFDYTGDRTPLLALQSSPIYQGHAKLWIDTNIAYTEPDRSRAAQLLAPLSGESVITDVLYAQTLAVIGQAGAARALFRALRPRAELWAADQSDNGSMNAWLAAMYAGMGERNEAERLIGETLSKLDPEREPDIAPVVLYYLAEAQALLGMHELALDALDRVLSMTSTISGYNVLTEPAFVPLHDSPRFQRIVQDDLARRRAAYERDRAAVAH